MIVLVSDLNSDIRSYWSQVVANMTASGVKVIHPSNSKELANAIKISSWSKHDRPDVVLHHNLGVPTDLDNALETLEFAGVRFANPFGLHRLFANRVGAAASLAKLGIKQPRWFFGSPADIPAELGEWVIQKGLNTHLVNLVERQRIYCSNEVGYYEEILPNPNSEGKNETVHWIFGHTFTVVKHDVFKYGLKDRPPRYLAETNNPDQVEIVRKIQSALEIDFFCVDFIGDTVIDVNLCPNAFCHEQAVSWFTNGIVRLA